MIELLSIPAIIAIVEALKMAGAPKKHAAVIAIVSGLLFGFIMGNVIAGLVTGLAASGLYSGFRSLLK